MSVRSFSCAVGAFVVSFFVAGAAGAAPDVAVVGFGGAAPVAERERMVELVHGAAGKLQTLTVQPLADTRRVLSSMRDLDMACTAGQLACDLRIGGLAGVRFVVSGDIDVLGNTLVARLTAADVVGQRELPLMQAVRVPMSSSTDAIALEQARRELQRALVRLLAPDEEVGNVEIVGAGGVTVVVDGVSRGVSPLPTLRLPPGRHEIWLGKLGFESATHSVDVAFGETVRVDSTLVPENDGSTPTTTTPTEDSRIKHRIAVFDVNNDRLPGGLTSVVQRALIAELRKLDGVIVIGSDEMNALLDDETRHQRMGCGDDPACLAAIAEVVGADTVIATSIGLVGQSDHQFTTMRVEASSLTIVETVSERLPDARALVVFIAPAVERMFPDLGLAPSATRGVDAKLVAEASGRPLPPAVFYGSAAATGAAAVVTVVAGTFALAAADDVDNASGAAARRSAEAALATGNSLFVASAVVTGALVVTTVGVAFFTDFDAP